MRSRWQRQAGGREGWAWRRGAAPRRADRSAAVASRSLVARSDVNTLDVDTPGLNSIFLGLWVANNASRRTAENSAMDFLLFCYFNIVDNRFSSWSSLHTHTHARTHHACMHACMQAGHCMQLCVLNAELKRCILCGNYREVSRVSELVRIRFEK